MGSTKIKKRENVPAENFIVNAPFKIPIDTRMRQSSSGCRSADRIGDSIKPPKPSSRVCLCIFYANYRIPVAIYVALDEPTCNSSDEKM